MPMGNQGTQGLPTAMSWLKRNLLSSPVPRAEPRKMLCAVSLGAPRGHLLKSWLTPTAQERKAPRWMADPPPFQRNKG